MFYLPVWITELMNVSHNSDVEGLMNFVVRYPPEWMNILRLNLFETAIHFAHSNDH